MKPLFFAGIAALCASVTLTAAPVAQVVAKARAAAGKDADLNAVKALRYNFKIADKDGKALGPLVSEYRAPVCQRDIDYTMKDQDGKDLEVVTAIDGLEGHRAVSIIGVPGRRILVMPSAEVNLRRDFAAANLTFFTPPPADRCTVVTAPDEKIDGIDCEVLDYKYTSGVTLRRYIAKADGKFVGNRVNSGDKSGDLMLNIGEQRVAGVIFPKSIRIVDHAGNPVRTLTLEKVEVNPTDIPDKAFATPLY